MGSTNPSGTRLAGAGSIPAGSGPFGIGTPTAGAAPASGAAGSRYLNPATRDYEQDSSTGQLKQMPRVRHRVLITVLTLITSSTALPRFGIKMPRKMGDTFEAEVSNSVRAALRQTTDTEKVMRIDGLKVERGMGGRARITISYTDLELNKTDSVIV